jgi:hypothetical protein
MKNGGKWNKMQKTRAKKFFTGKLVCAILTPWREGG